MQCHMECWYCLINRLLYLFMCIMNVKIIELQRLLVDCYVLESPFAFKQVLDLLFSLQIWLSSFFVNLLILDSHKKTISTWGPTKHNVSLFFRATYLNLLLSLIMILLLSSLANIYCCVVGRNLDFVVHCTLDIADKSCQSQQYVDNYVRYVAHLTESLVKTRQQISNII